MDGGDETELWNRLHPSVWGFASYGFLHRVIARYEAIPCLQSSYAKLPVEFAIASYLAMTIYNILILWREYAG
jgi:hypothetical protein